MEGIELIIQCIINCYKYNTQGGKMGKYKKFDELKAKATPESNARQRVHHPGRARLDGNF